MLCSYVETDHAYYDTIHDIFIIPPSVSIRGQRCLDSDLDHLMMKFKRPWYGNLAFPDLLEDVQHRVSVRIHEMERQVNRLQRINISHEVDII